MPGRAFAFLITVIAASSSLAALEPAAVRRAAAYSGSRGGASLLVVQEGKTLHASGTDEARNIYSGTKAFWCLAALAAAQDGLLGLDERVADTIPEWRKDARKARITIRQLLDFSCGLEPAFYLHHDDPGDRAAITLRLPMVAEPGNAFIYGPSALQVFHAVLKAKLRGPTPHQYLERRVLSPLGLGRQRYLQDRAGNPLLATGWALTARQWSKLGQLVLNGGSPVVSADSLAQSWRGSSANRSYSLGWWNNRAAPRGREFDFEAMLNRKWFAQDWSGACICRDAPNDLVACIGSLYQRLYVVPSLHLVIVRHGNGASFSDARFLRLLLGRTRSALVIRRSENWQRALRIRGARAPRPLFLAPRQKQERDPAWISSKRTRVPGRSVGRGARAPTRCYSSGPTGSAFMTGGLTPAGSAPPGVASMRSPAAFCQ